MLAMRQINILGIFDRCELKHTNSLERLRRQLWKSLQYCFGPETLLYKTENTISLAITRFFCKCVTTSFIISNNKNALAFITSFILTAPSVLFVRTSKINTEKLIFEPHEYSFRDTNLILSAIDWITSRILQPCSIQHIYFCYYVRQLLWYYAHWIPPLMSSRRTGAITLIINIPCTTQPKLSSLPSPLLALYVCLCVCGCVCLRACELGTI